MATAAKGDASGGKHDPRVGALQIGYHVALTLTPGVAPLRCYVGRVEAMDNRGIRLTLVDGVSGAYTSWDLFVPWEHIAAALVATPDHHLDRGWGQAAAQWQERSEQLGNTGRGAGDGPAAEPTF